MQFERDRMSEGERGWTKRSQTSSCRLEARILNHSGANAKYQHRSGSLTLMMRNKQGMSKLQHHNAQLKAKVEMLEKQIGILATKAPGLASALDIRPSKTNMKLLTRPKAGGYSSHQASFFLRFLWVSLQSRHSKRKEAGGGLLKQLSAYVVRLVIRVQNTGFQCLVKSMRLAEEHFRDEAASIKMFLILGIASEWDEAHQMVKAGSVGRKDGNRFMRAIRRQIADPTLAQLVYMHITCVVVKTIKDEDPFVPESAFDILLECKERSEQRIIPTLKLSGTAAEDLVKCIDIGMSGICSEGLDPRWFFNCSAGFDWFHWVPWGDAFPANRRGVKHYMRLEQLENLNIVPRDDAAVREKKTVRAIDDTHKCLTHQSQRVKNDATDVFVMVNHMYSFGRHMGHSGPVQTLSNNIVAIVHVKFRYRLKQRPPQEAVLRNGRVIDFLFCPDDVYHLRVNKMSEMLQDIYFLYRQLPGYWDGSFLDHFCWDDVAKKPCCSNEEEARDKMKAAFHNFFLSRRVVIVTMARWTNLLKVLILLIFAHAIGHVFV